MNGSHEYPDVRVARTRRKLKEALLKLLEIKSYYELKVKEVSEFAGVNRVTFYDHYDSLHDLVTELIDDKMWEYEKIIEPKEKHPESVGEVHAMYFDQVVQTIGHIRDNAVFYRIMLVESGESRVSDFIHERLSRSLYNSLSRLQSKPLGVDLAIYAHWTMGGAISLFKYWLKDGMKQSDTFMIEQLRRLAFVTSTALDPATNVE